MADKTFEELLRDDDRVNKFYDFEMLRRLVIMALPYWRRVLFAIFLMISLAILANIGPLLNRMVFDTYIPAKMPAGLIRIAIIYVCILITELCLRFLLFINMEFTGNQFLYDLRIRMFKHLQKMALAFFDRNPVGRLMTRVSNDVEQLNQLFTMGIFILFGDLFNMLWMAGLMLYLSPRLALVCFCVLPLIAIATFRFRMKAREAFRTRRKILAKLNAFMQESFSGILTIQIFNREKKNEELFDEINQSHYDAIMQAVLAHSIFFPLVNLFGALSTSLLIWYGGGLVIQQVITFGLLVAFVEYMGRFFIPIRHLAELLGQMQSAMSACERIFTLLDTEEVIPETDKPLLPPPPPWGIEFKEVWFGYKPEEPVLRGVSFQVEPCNTVAIVGHTGAGKTTIASLVGRLYDIQSGGIYINGVDIRNLHKRDLRENLAVVMQDVFLFSGTINFNITLGAENIDKERMEWAARQVNAHAFISRLPNGYEQEVGQRGVTLSAGQRQLLAFARALAHNPEILILDEATSSVDTETEMLIQDALAKLFKNRTSIVIAHRLSTIRNADKIIVLHKGKVREVGTHEELYQQNGLYRKLHDLQYYAKGLSQ